MLAREIEGIRCVGMRFECGKKVGADLGLDEIEGQFDAVFLSIGTWQEAAAPVAGAELKGVRAAVPFLETIARGEPVALGRRVAVIGGGNAAIDSARTAVRLGAETTVVYRRERKDMPAIAEETAEAEREGVRFLFLAAPHRIVGDPRGNVKGLEIMKTRLGEFDKSGRQKPVATGEITRFDCDSVILAVGESVDLEFGRLSGLGLSPSGTIVADRFTLETSRSNVFAGGDVVSGASNVTKAMAYGKRAARSMDRRLTGSDRFPALLEAFEYDQTPPPPAAGGPRRRGHERPVSVRVRGSEEVVEGLTTADAIEEAARCLRCDVRA